MNLLAVSLVICVLCVKYLGASQTYKAAVMHIENKEIDASTPFIHEAGKAGVDILVMPSLEPSVDNYDEIVKTMSLAAKQGHLYVVTHLYEKTRCQLGHEIIRSNLVFDREGAIVAVYRKPLNAVANCTISTSDLVTFTTDFGVTFGLLMEEDLVLQDLERMRELQNFVLSGRWSSEVPFLSAAQFAPSWSYITNANLISSSGIFSGKAGLKTGKDQLTVAELQTDGGNYLPAVPLVNPTTLNLPTEDLNQYTIRPLDLTASSRGYKESVCHGSFCCEFYVKTGEISGMFEASYGLAAFNGVLHFGKNHNIGIQNCAVFACTRNLRSFEASAQNKTNILFEKITISANFTKQNAQFPIVQSTAELPTEKFKFETKTDGVSKQVTLEIVDSKSVINFGIFGRDFTKDFETNFVYGGKNNSDVTSDIYDYIYNEDVQEFFDYVWIRLRVLIVVVSIYILEMM